MFLLRWYKEWLQIRDEHLSQQRELKYCESCETLKLQLSIANDEKKQLLNRLIEAPKVESEKEVKEFKPIMTHPLIWNARRQMLEREDKDKLKKLEAVKKSQVVTTTSNINRPLTVEQLEKELEVNE